MSASATTQRGSDRNALFKLALGAIGVVYGDIGTSPLYAIKESFHPSHGIPLTSDNIFGILSIVFWSLMLIVSFKYLIVVLRADNKGEGGITAILALLLQKRREGGSRIPHHFLILLGVFGTGLLYGDGMITPAISVLSAVEGIQVNAPAFEPLIVPMTVVILIFLFWLQSSGTARVGAVFGPVMLLWFFTIAAIGLPWIIRNPVILGALNPKFAVQFMWNNGWHAFLVLSSVVLCITGAEALFADIGHFGKQPIRLGWFCVVFPALLLNYFGQGALVLTKGSEVLDHPFYALVSGWMHYPLVVIATIAAVIASQALISGAFSLTQQAVQLGYLPRLTIRHTSRQTQGQIYVPKINLMLMVACIALVLIFKTSSRLAAAYGFAAIATMLITSTLFFSLLRNVWKWSRWRATALVSVFVIIDVGYFAANTVKLFHGGWIPLTIAAIIFSVMATWKKGRQTVSEMLMGSATPLNGFFDELARQNPPRVKGTAVFMTLTQNIAPSVLLHHYRHNQSLHERIILLSIVTENVPEVPLVERVRVTELEQGFVKLVARYGYMETPDIAEILILSEGAGLRVDHEKVSYYLGRETFLTTGHSRMARWRKKIFVLLSRNARSATEFFNLPPNQVIEIGSQIQI